MIGVPDEEWGERVHAVVQLYEARTRTTATVPDHCRLHLAAYKCPRSIDSARICPEPKRQAVQTANPRRVPDRHRCRSEGGPWLMTAPRGTEPVTAGPLGDTLSSTGSGGGRSDMPFYLASLGATVIRIQGPGGDVSWNVPPT